MTSHDACALLIDFFASVILLFPRESRLHSHLHSFFSGHRDSYPHTDRPWRRKDDLTTSHHSLTLAIASLGSVFPPPRLLLNSPLMPPAIANLPETRAEASSKTSIVPHHRHARSRVPRMLESNEPRRGSAQARTPADINLRPFLNDRCNYTSRQ